MAKTVAALPDLWAAAQRPGVGCSGTATFCIGRAIAAAYVDEAYRAEDAGRSPEERLGILAQGQSYGSPWQLLATLGDIHLTQAIAAHAPAAYEVAAGDLQKALDTALEVPRCPGEQPASAASLAALRRRAGEALLQSAHFVATQTRDGECGGIFHTRDLGIVPTPVPITFEYKLASLTPEGIKVAEVMLTCIKEQKFKRIRLSGHTDDVGSDAYNMDLSAQRLRSVRDHLVQGGFTGEIALEPKGKREPFQWDDPGQHTPTEVDRANRRVALEDGTK